MAPDTSSGPAHAQLFVGEGGMPPDLESVNWGAALFSVIWAWVYGVWGWLAVFLSILFVPVLLLQIPLLALGGVRDMRIWQSVLDPLTAIAYWVASIVFALRFNRTLWEREHRRFAAAGGDPQRPIPLERFRKSVRFWARLGFALLIAGAAVQLAAVALGRFSVTSALLGLPSGIVVVGLLFVLDRMKIGRKAAQS